MKYTLKLSKWVNGDSVGRGEVQMLNKHGFSCCLGQFARQRGVACGVLQGKGEPSYTAAYFGRVYDDQFVALIGSNYASTKLAIDCIAANDNGEFEGRRVERLREVLEAAGHELEVLE